MTEPRPEPPAEPRPEPSTHVRQRDRSLPFELPPPLQTSAQRRGERAYHHPVHHLAIREPLQEDEPGETLVLVAFHEKGEHGREPVDEQEDRIVAEDLLEVRQRIG